ncbi:sulfite exporter TauE/SafE family protein [candidate division WWE3 bacterium]|uniref:Sulfite exporter TauE/SafE family protein n=1 Tax=candidate division WWE3 bacterium TaxID=2053526 RepID=A0A955RQC2_UNCKA|nr:sulfite exporter TauE/SafE family protein [candidate division WWE3 bacterium]
MEIGFLLAFTTGILSFFSPCVIPLLPIYVSMIAGISLSELNQEKTYTQYSRQIVINSFIYVLGFSIMFVLLGASASALGKLILVNRDIFTQVGGGIIIVFGILSLGLVEKIPFLQRIYQLKPNPNLRSMKLLGPFIMGITFALAWTPCAGAILGGILTLAAVRSTITEGGLLLLAYSVGISIPFLFISVTLPISYPLISKLGSKLKYLQILGGILLIITGILLVSNQFGSIGRYFLNLLGNSNYFHYIQDRI